MLTKCANPTCREEFRSLRWGRLFVTDPATARTSGDVAAPRKGGRLEYFWLCDNCTKTMKVIVDNDHHVVVTSTPVSTILVQQEKGRGWRHG